MLKFSTEENYTNITVKMNTQLMWYILRAVLLLSSCLIVLQLILDNVPSATDTQLDNSLAKRKLLNVGGSNAVGPSGARKQTRKELFRKLTGTRKGGACADIFNRNLEIPWTPDQAENYKQFREFLDTNVLEPLHSINFTIEGNSGKYPDQWRLYCELASLGFVTNICETGFNAGHSAFMWLNVNPDVHVYSFDIGIHRYTRQMADALLTLFPGRLTLTMGDSRVTVPRFHQKHPHISCDMVVVDGGHHEDIPERDLDNFSLMTKSINNLILLDDWPGLEDVNITIGGMWRRNIAAHRVKEIFYCMKDNSYWKNGITLGQYL